MLNEATRDLSGEERRLLLSEQGVEVRRWRRPTLEKREKREDSPQRVGLSWVVRVHGEGVGWSLLDFLERHPVYEGQGVVLTEGLELGLAGEGLELGKVRRWSAEKGHEEKMLVEGMPWTKVKMENAAREVWIDVPRLRRAMQMVGILTFMCQEEWERSQQGSSRILEKPA